MYQKPQSSRKAKSILGQKNTKLAECKKFSKTSNSSNTLASIYNLFHYQSCVRFNNNTFWTANFAEFNGIRDQYILNQSEIQLDPHERIYITTSVLMEMISLHKSLDRVIDKFAFVPAMDSFRDINSPEMETAVVNLSEDYPLEASSRNLRLKKSASDTQIIPSIEKLFEFVKRHSEDVDNLSLEAILSNNSIRLVRSTSDFTSINRKKLQKAESIIKSCIINLESVCNFLSTEEPSRDKGDEFIVSGCTTKSSLKNVDKDSSKVILNFKRSHPDSDLKIIIRKASANCSTNKQHMNEGYLSYYPAAHSEYEFDEVRLPNFDKTPSTSTRSSSVHSEIPQSISNIDDPEQRTHMIKYGSAVEMRGSSLDFPEAKKRPCHMGKCSCTKLHFEESTNLTFRNGQGEDVIVSVKIKPPNKEHVPRTPRNSVQQNAYDYEKHEQRRRSSHDHRRSSHDPHPHGVYDRHSIERRYDHHGSDDHHHQHHDEHDSDHHEAFYTTYSSSQTPLKPGKTKDQICSSMDLDVKELTERLRKQGNKIVHTKPEIQKGLNEIGAENLMNASRPAKCCRKRTIIGEHVNYSPYSPSLNSLPLDTEDLEIIKENAMKYHRQKYNTAAYYISLGEEESPPMWILFEPHVNYLTQCSADYALKQSTSSLKSADATQEKLKYYINLSGDAGNKKYPEPRRVYEVRFFEIQKIKNIQSSTSNVSDNNSLNTFLKNCMRQSSSNNSYNRTGEGSSKSSSSTIKKKSTTKCKSVRVYNISQRSLPNDEKGLHFYMKAYEKFLKATNDKKKAKPQSAPSSSKDKNSVTRLFYNKLVERMESDGLPINTKSENTATSCRSNPKVNNYFKSIGSDPTELFEKILRTYNYQKDVRPKTRRKKTEFYMARSKSDMNTKFRHKFEDADHILRNHLRDYAKKKQLSQREHCPKRTPSKSFLSYMTRMLCELENSKKGRIENEGDFVNNHLESPVRMNVMPEKILEAKAEKPKGKWDISKLTRSLNGVNSQPNVEAGMDEEEPSSKSPNELTFRIHVQKCNKEKRLYLDKMEFNNNDRNEKNIKLTDKKSSASKNSQTDKTKNHIESCQTDNLNPTKLSLMDIRNDYSQNTVLSSSVNSDNNIDYGYYTESCDPYEAFNCNQTNYDVFDNCVLLFDDILSHASNYDDDSQDISDSISTTLLKLKQMMATKYLENNGNPFSRNYMVYQNACCQQSQPTIFKRLFAAKKRRSDVAPGPCNLGYTNNIKIHGCSDACNLNKKCKDCGQQELSCYDEFEKTVIVNESSDEYEKVLYPKSCNSPMLHINRKSCLKPCSTCWPDIHKPKCRVADVTPERILYPRSCNIADLEIVPKDRSVCSCKYKLSETDKHKCQCGDSAGPHGGISMSSCSCGGNALKSSSCVCTKKSGHVPPGGHDRNKYDCFESGTHECNVCPPWKPCVCKSNTKFCKFHRVELCACNSKNRSVHVQATPETRNVNIGTFQKPVHDVWTQRSVIFDEHSAQTLSICRCENCREKIAQMKTDCGCPPTTDIDEEMQMAMRLKAIEVGQNLAPPVDMYREGDKLITPHDTFSGYHHDRLKVSPSRITTHSRKKIDPTTEFDLEFKGYEESRVLNVTTTTGGNIENLEDQQLYYNTDFNVWTLTKVNLFPNGKKSYELINISSNPSDFSIPLFEY